MSDHSLVSSSPARPSPRHDDGRPLRLAISGAVVAPRNKNKSTDRHTIQRSSPATGHRRRGGCYRVYEPTTGGGFSPAAPLPTSRPQHALSDSTHVPLPPRGPRGCRPSYSLQSYRGCNDRPSTTSRRGVVPSFPRRAFNTCPGGRDKYEREERTARHLQGWSY